MTSTPARSGMPEHFGIRITDADKDKLVGELDVDDRHLNNSGHVHGGALAAFADDLGGRLAGLNAPPGFRTTTIESKTNIFRACVPGRLTGVAVPVHVGRRMIVLQISIYRPDYVEGLGHVAGFNGIDLESRSADQVVHLAIELTAPLIRLQHGPNRCCQRALGCPVMIDIRRGRASPEKWSHLMGRLPRASRPAPPVQVVGSAFYSGGKIEYLSPCSWKPAFAGNLPEFARNLPVVLTA